MKNQSRSWEKPQLIILSRGMPEETLTQDCKVKAIGFVGAEGSEQTSCEEIAKGVCGACQARNSGS